MLAPEGAAHPVALRPLGTVSQYIVGKSTKTMRKILTFLMMTTFIITSCSSSKEVTSSSFIQKRKFRKGWHVDLPKRERDPVHAIRVENSSPVQPDLTPGMELPEAEASTDLTLIADLDDNAIALGDVDQSPAASILHGDPNNSEAKNKRLVTLLPQALTHAMRMAVATQEGTDANGPMAGPASPEGGTATNTWAIVGFVCSLFIPLLGLIFSLIALNQIKKTGEKGRGLAIAGLVISIVTMLIVIAVLA
jgi:hypothetical protein